GVFGKVPRGDGTDVWNTHRARCPSALSHVGPTRRVVVLADDDVIEPADQAGVRGSPGLPVSERAIGDSCREGAEATEPIRVLLTFADPELPSCVGLRELVGSVEGDLHPIGSRDPLPVPVSTE